MLFEFLWRLATSFWFVSSVFPICSSLVVLSFCVFVLQRSLVSVFMFYVNLLISMYSVWLLDPSLTLKVSYRLFPVLVLLPCSDFSVLSCASGLQSPNQPSAFTQSFLLLVSISAVVGLGIFDGFKFWTLLLSVQSELKAHLLFYVWLEFSKLWHLGTFPFILFYDNSISRECMLFLCFWCCIAHVGCKILLH